VKYPLLGPTGAAIMFGPQKGATPAMVEDLESSITQFSTLVNQQTSKDMTNLVSGAAAGGITAGLWAFCDA